MFRTILGSVLIFAFGGSTAQISYDFDQPAEIESWLGDTASFYTEGGYLHLDADPDDGSALLMHPGSLQENAIWDFQLVLDFSPSSSNYALVYLLSDSLLPSKSLYVLIGGFDDTFEIYLQSGGENQLIASAEPGILDLRTLDLRINVTHSQGLWSLNWNDVSGISGDLEWDQSIEFPSLFTGFEFIFSPSRSNKFSLGHFEVTGDPWLDSFPPQPVSFRFLENDQLDICYDEPVNFTMADFRMSHGIDLSCYPSSATCIRCDPNPALTNGTDYKFLMTGISDAAGNESQPLDTVLFYFRNPVPVYGDIIVSEILSDPTPSVGLPDSEYLEILNTSEKTFDIRNWTLNNSLIGERLMWPGDRLILCPDDEVVEFESVEAIGLQSWPGLPNSGGLLALNDEAGNVVFEVDYSPRWISDPDKRAGGWALEIIDGSNKCSGDKNWDASVAHQGGTPGTVNSIDAINPDRTPASISSILMKSDHTLRIEFDEKIMAGDISQDSISIDPALYILALVQENYSDWMEIEFTDPISSGVIYQILLKSAEDCAGNTGDIQSNFAIAGEAEFNDLVVNEIMYDPYAGSPEYIEVYNRSGSYLDLKNWKAESGRKSSQRISTLTDDHNIIRPGEYKVLAPDESGISVWYPDSPQGSVIETMDWSSLDNDSGFLLLRNGQGNVVDSLYYFAEMHFPLLETTRGTSLERSDFGLDTNDADNWQSASGLSDGGTPGYRNSIAPGDLSSVERVSIAPNTFSPDNDGIDDVTVIRVNSDLPVSGQITIYDASGYMVKDFPVGFFGSGGNTIWKGLDSVGLPVKEGLYLILIRLIDSSGAGSVVRTSVVVDY